MASSRRRRQRPKRNAPKEPKRANHVMDPDMSIPACSYSGRRTCKVCGQLAEPGDPRHPLHVQEELPDPGPADEREAWREHDKAVLGEKEDD